MTDSTTNDGPIQTASNETGDVNQTSMQSVVFNNGKAEGVDGNTDHNEGFDGDEDNRNNQDDNVEKYEENLEMEKADDVPVVNSCSDDLDSDSSKNDIILKNEKESSRVNEIVLTERNNSNGEEEEKQASPTMKDEKICIDRQTYENLVLDQRKLKDELKRLKEHLITVEDDYTTEILELEGRESRVINELRQAMETITQLKTCIKEVDQPINWSERLEKLKEERDKALDDVSKLDDKVHRLTASLTNLQLVIEQIQKENEKKLVSLTKQHQAALESERAIQNDLRQEVEMYEKKSMEAAQALQAATRLTENIDKKEEIIQNLKQELCDKEKQIANLELDKANLKASFEGKVDKQVIKNLILGYFGTPHNKKHEVERLLARVLDFNEQEMARAGLSFGRPSAKFGLGSSSSTNLTTSSTTPTPSGSILLAPLQSSSSTAHQHPTMGNSSSSSYQSSTVSSSSHPQASHLPGSLSKMFVEFLEAESRPKGASANLPTSTLTRELARDLTKAALTSNAKGHLFLEPTLTGIAKVTPAPVSPSTSTLLPSSSSSPSQLVSTRSLQPHQLTGNHILPANGKPLNPLLVPASSLPSNKFSTNFSGSTLIHNNSPIRPITINSSNLGDFNDQSISIGSSSSSNHHKSASLSSTTSSSSSSSSSSLISNPMSSLTNSIKPITYDANNHTQQTSVLLSSLPSTATATTTTPTSLSSLPSLASSNLMSASETVQTSSLSSSAIITSSSPSPSLAATLIHNNTISQPVMASIQSSSSSSSTSSSLLSPAASSSDYNSLISNSHFKVKK